MDLLPQPRRQSLFQTTHPPALYLQAELVPSLSEQGFPVLAHTPDWSGHQVCEAAKASQCAHHRHPVSTCAQLPVRRRHCCPGRIKTEPVHPVSADFAAHHMLGELPFPSAKAKKHLHQKLLVLLHASPVALLQFCSCFSLQDRHSHCYSSIMTD